jgi:WD40 repeat protein/DNA-binding SARP family transcriptional activator/tRNA A-37 threonylcarbamoyl transferase component Bud32/energy-coupling factor transporter ATP-binding protein EcfA2
VQVQVLGPIAAVVPGGRPVRLGGTQQQRLLAALATVPDHPVVEDRLIEILWPDAVPESAHGTLQSYVSRLRSQLGHAAVVTSDVGYALSTSIVELDAARFERLLTRARTSDPLNAIALYDEALAMWRGPAFGVWAGEWWAKPVADRLEALRSVAASERVDALLALDRADEAVAETEILVAANPLRESFVLQRVRAQHLSGRSADALRGAAGFRKRLLDQAGLEPSPALAELERRILEHDPELVTAPLSRAMRGYAIGELLAEGAHGAVFAATQPALGRTVAIKVVRKDRADDPDFVRRFEAEAQLVARLEHPSIVPLYDYWREPGGAFLVFRLLRGGSLQDLLARGERLGIGQVDEIIERVGDALAAAHRVGVVHRDVRPANVLFDDDGHPYLTDFGIAVEHSDDDAALDDVAGLTAVAAHLLNRLDPAEATPLDTRQSVLRRASSGEITTIVELLGEWRLARGITTSSTPTPDRPRARRRNAGPVVNPYKGLRPFSEADRGEFFGRTAACAQLATVVAERSFVAVVGPSGSGKSSLVLAGLVPQLRDNGYVVTTMTPGVRPMWSLATALRRVATEAQVTDDGDDPAALLRTVAVARPVLLVLDQLEELWTVAVTADRDEFIGALDAVLDDASSKLRVVATVRADFYDRPLADARLGPRTSDGSYPLAPLTAAELEAAIDGPLAGGAVVVEPGLVAQIIADVAAQAGALPLLQFTLSTLFDTREGDLITLRAYTALGGVAGAVASEAENLHQQLSPADQEQMRELFEALVTPGDGTDDTRRRAKRGELGTVPAKLLERLDHARLLTFDRDAATGEPTVEIAHEALLVHWPRLRSWIDASRDELQARRQLRDATAAWARSDREHSHLFRGARLATTLERVDANRVGFDERSFLDASIIERDREQARERQRLRRTQTLLGATAALLVVALLAGSVALVQRSRADDQRSQAVAARDRADIDRMVAQSRADARFAPNRAMLLAVEAYDRSPSWKTAGAIEAVLAQQPIGVLAYLAGDGPFGPLEYGKSVIVGRDGATVAVWSAADFRRLRTISDPGTDHGPVRLSGDDQFVAVTGNDGVSIYSVDTGARQAQLSFASVGTAIAFDPADHDRLAVGHFDGSVEIVRWRTGATDVRVGPHAGIVQRLSFSADGRLLSTSSRDGTARVWNARTGTPVTTPLASPPSANGIRSIIAQLSRSGNLIGAVSTDNKIRVWRVADSTLMAEFTLSEPSPLLNSVDFISDDVLVVGGSGIGQRSYDLRTHTEVRGDLGDSTLNVVNVAVSPDAKTLAVVTPGEIKIQALDDRQLGATTSLQLPPALRNATTTQTMVTANADSTKLLLFDSSSYIYDLTTKPVTQRIVEFPGTGELKFARYTADGRMIETLRQDFGTMSSSYQLWDPANFAPISAPVSLPGLAFTVALSPDGRLVAASDLREILTTSALRVFDVGTGELVNTFTDLDTIVAGVLVSQVIRLINNIAFSADSKQVAALTLANGAAAVWDLATSNVRILAPRNLSSIAFSNDGSWLSTGNVQQEFELRDPVTLAVRLSMGGRGNASLRPQFNPAQPLLKSDNGCGGLGVRVNGGTQLWDIEKGVEIGVGLPGYCAAWAPDGKTILTMDDTSIQIWSIDANEWRAAACRAAGRNLTQDEWKKYGPNAPYRATCG